MKAKEMMISPNKTLNTKMMMTTRICMVVKISLKVQVRDFRISLTLVTTYSDYDDQSLKKIKLQQFVQCKISLTLVHLYTPELFY